MSTPDDQPISRSERHKADGEKDCAGPKQRHGLDTRVDEAPAAAVGDAPVGAGTSQDECDRAFEAYWQALIASTPVLAKYRDRDAFRGLNFADFRASQRLAFRAGWNSDL